MNSFDAPAWYWIVGVFLVLWVINMAIQGHTDQPTMSCPAYLAQCQ